MYSVWSRGRQIGETDLGFIYRENGCRTGWFHPNVLGEQLMPAATGVAPAMRAARDARRYDEDEPTVVAAVEREKGLALKLRGPTGAVIETEYVAIIDTHYLLSIPPSIDEDEPLSEELQAEVDAMLEEFLEDQEPEEPWRQEQEETEFPRYQIQIRLLDPEMFLP